MIYIYVLKSINHDISYVGMTQNLENRINEHNKGKSKFTKTFMPWKVVYSETRSDWKKARIREKYLKSSAGKQWLKANNFIPL